MQPLIVPPHTPKSLHVAGSAPEHVGSVVPSAVESRVVEMLVGCEISPVVVLWAVTWNV
jgi:hypothetical protein